MRKRYLELVVASVLSRELNSSPTKSDLDAFLHFGGFPDPFLLHQDRELRIWQHDPVSSVVREDLRDLEHVREIWSPRRGQSSSR